MSTYSIGEVAERSGFTDSALRYYERIGLVAPAARTDAGYRVYDDRTLGRLAFISRAKQLGCSLGEITDLVAIWDGEQCGPVQSRFHRLVTDKIIDAQGQIAELTVLVHQLEDAAGQLAGPATDGPCGDDCACVAGPGTANAEAAEPVRRVEALDAAPVACTLEPGSVPDRLAEWRAILDSAPARTRTEDGALRVELSPDVDVGELAQLVAAEQQCCAFFSFAITVDQQGVALEVRAPDGAEAVGASLFRDAT